jgi:sirohydrochlorin cobaltochelatase
VTAGQPLRAVTREETSRQHQPSPRWRYGRPLGPHPVLLLDVLAEGAERVSVRGHIRMNCDTCAYRIALPGFGGKVGRPQTPHHHPDDQPGPGSRPRAAPLTRPCEKNK